GRVVVVGGGGAGGGGEPRGRLGAGARGRGGDGHDGRRVDGDDDLHAALLAVGVADRRSDGVDAGAERARRDRPAHAERAVPARAPREVGGQVAVLEVGGGGREGDRRPREIARAARRGGDGHHRSAVDRDRDRRARRAVAAVGDRGGDDVRAGAEGAGRDRAARAERAVAARGPDDDGGEGPVLGGRK